MRRTPNTNTNTNITYILSLQNELPLLSRPLIGVSRTIQRPIVYTDAETEAGHYCSFRVLDSASSGLPSAVLGSFVELASTGSSPILGSRSRG